MTEKSRVKALVLNVLTPGLGQVYAHKIKKGVFHFVSLLLLVLSIRFLSYHLILLVAILLGILIYYIYIMVSAYRSVDEDKEYPAKAYDKWYVYVGIVVFFAILASNIQRQKIDSITPISLMSIATPAMSPSLMPADRLAFKKTDDIERNSFVLFKVSGQLQTMFNFRCVGLPGDSLQVVNSQVLVNGEVLKEERNMNHRYLIQTNEMPIKLRIWEELGVTEFEGPIQNYLYTDSSNYNGINYMAMLTDRQAIKLSELKFISKVEKQVRTNGQGENYIYPKSKGYQWNADFYGPLYLPRKGDRISINKNTLEVYNEVISKENSGLEMRDNALYLNDKLIETYEFKEDYFFMMGDSRHNALDSRYIGMVPKSSIIGKAMYLYWSDDLSRIGQTFN